MEDTQVFRLILVLGLLAILPVGLYYRLKAAATKEMLDRRQEGLFILLTLRSIALARMLGLLAFVINPEWMAWSAVSLPVWMRWMGVGLGVTAGVLLVAMFRSLGRNLTDTVVTRADHTLVTTGPYRWVRHPLYTAMAMAVVADSLVTENWFLAVTGVIAVALLMLRARTEEANLIKRFGDEYRAYMKRTGRYVPRPGIGADA